jgi:hypothetical protein
MRHVRAMAPVAFVFVITACSQPVDVGICSEPAPYYESAVPAPGYTVNFVEGTNPHRTTYDLEQKYGFEAESIYALGFYADFSDAVREYLRCEAVVKFVEQSSEPSPPPGA